MYHLGFDFVNGAWVVDKKETGFEIPELFSLLMKRHCCYQTIKMMGSRGTGTVLSRAARMRQKLQSSLEASALDIEDVSYQHAGHAAVKDNANETHFNIKVISPKFEGQSLVKRHRMVYDLLTDELNSGLHAISIVAKTPKESGS